MKNLEDSWIKVFSKDFKIKQGSKTKTVEMDFHKSKYTPTSELYSSYSEEDTKKNKFRSELNLTESFELVSKD